MKKFTRRELCQLIQLKCAIDNLVNVLAISDHTDQDILVAQHRLAEAQDKHLAWDEDND